MTTKDELTIYHVFVFGFPFFALRSLHSAYQDTSSTVKLRKAFSG